MTYIIPGGSLDRLDLMIAEGRAMTHRPKMFDRDIIRACATPLNREAPMTEIDRNTIITARAAWNEAFLPDVVVGRIAFPGQGEGRYAFDRDKANAQIEAMEAKGGVFLGFMTNEDAVRATVECSYVQMPIQSEGDCVTEWTGCVIEEMDERDAQRRVRERAIVNAIFRAAFKEDGFVSIGATACRTRRQAWLRLTGVDVARISFERFTPARVVGSVVIAFGLDHGVITDAADNAETRELLSEARELARKLASEAVKRTLVA